MYEFITNKTLTQLERSGIICLKSGSTLYDIKRACDILRAKKNRSVNSPVPKLYSKNQQNSEESDSSSSESTVETISGGILFVTLM